MRATSLPRSAFVALPLVLALAACNDMAAAPSGPNNANLAIEQQWPALEAGNQVVTDHPCPNIFEPPCKDGTGCTPSHDEILEGNGPLFAHLSWTYDCNPDGYHVGLKYAPGDFIYEGNVSAYDPAIHGPARSWSSDDPLAPATRYQWDVGAYQDGVFSGYDHVATSFFWTGPICTQTQSVMAP
ncbi:MAG: hypothetical protein MUO38_09175 [Anaerolineales bacterium]|nr:hypothetical protein [Anaerolineales bacterium]